MKKLIYPLIFFLILIIGCKTEASDPPPATDKSEKQVQNKTLPADAIIETVRFIHKLGPSTGIGKISASAFEIDIPGRKFKIIRSEESIVDPNPINDFIKSVDTELEKEKWKSVGQYEFIDKQFNKLIKSLNIWLKRKIKPEYTLGKATQPIYPATLRITIHTDKGKIETFLESNALLLAGPIKSDNLEHQPIHDMLYALNNVLTWLPLRSSGTPGRGWGPVSKNGLQMTAWIQGNKVYCLVRNGTDEPVQYDSGPSGIGWWEWTKVKAYDPSLKKWIDLRLTPHTSTSRTRMGVAPPKKPLAPLEEIVFKNKYPEGLELDSNNTDTKSTFSVNLSKYIAPTSLPDIFKIKIINSGIESPEICIKKDACPNK